MGKPEAYVEDYLKEQVESVDGICWKFTSGVRGVPDRILVLKKRVLFVETKAKKGRLSPLQRYQIGRIRARGNEARVMHTRELVDEFIEEVKAGGS